MSQEQKGSSAWKKLLAKKWVFPAAYVAAAAIILTLMWVYQNTSTDYLDQEDLGLTEVVEYNHDVIEVDSDAIAVTAQLDLMQWPVSDRSEVEVVMPFFDSEASSEDKQAAMVEYGDTFTPHMGVGLARQDNESFDVLAAKNGTVVIVAKDPLAGNVVEIEHEGGLITVYQSLSDVQVSMGMEVEKGHLIARAGRNELEKHLGVHVHFEIRHNGEAVNPEQYILEQ